MPRRQCLAVFILLTTVLPAAAFWQIYGCYFVEDSALALNVSTSSCAQRFLTNRTPALTNISVYLYIKEASCEHALKHKCIITLRKFFSHNFNKRSQSSSNNIPRLELLHHLLTNFVSNPPHKKSYLKLYNHFQCQKKCSSKTGTSKSPPNNSSSSATTSPSAPRKSFPSTALRGWKKGN